MACVSKTQWVNSIQEEQARSKPGRISAHWVDGLQAALCDDDVAPDRVRCSGVDELGLPAFKVLVPGLARQGARYAVAAPLVRPCAVNTLSCAAHNAHVSSVCKRRASRCSVRRAGASG